ncbi:hypothetical protein DRP53_09375 [candidate division WOR-3 bacterium]|uniref:Uncharacterized protein n=1 Tax=candidate division WOR-3 bacterium TaxID=2052148 RepID=A0A660SE41_UNCW3|nr:MAG: hypothetical protein DRP53_09375 [candidate division WOR-3 bacterium]
MRKAVIFLLPLTLGAAHILIWNYDPLDRYYEPELSDSVDCSYWLKEAVSAHGHTYEVRNGKTLPADLDPYDCIIATLGFFRC